MSDHGLKHRWGYNEQPGVVGPKDWPKHYTVGKNQSPIDITVCDCLLSTIGGRVREPLKNLHTCCLSNNQLINLSTSLETKVRLDTYESTKRRSSQQYHRQLLGTHDNDPDDRRRSSSSSSRSSVDSTTQQLQLNEDKASCYKNQRTRYCITSKKIFIGYPRYISAVPLSNTGHSWQIDIPVDLSAHTCK